MAMDQWNHETCKHSCKRSVSHIGKESLRVYASCKSPEQKSMYRGYYLENRNICEACDHYTPGK